MKSEIRYGISHNYAKIKVDSFNFLPLEKTMTFHNVIILLRKLGIKIKIITTTIYFLEKSSNYLKKCFLYKCYVMKELTLLKKLILIKQVHQKSAILGIF